MGRYLHAVNETSIPIYVIAGNHDTGTGENYGYYTRYTGNTENSYVTIFRNFDFVGINWRNPGSPEPDEFAEIRKTLLNSPRSFTIIATHYNMDDKGISHPWEKISISN